MYILILDWCVYIDESRHYEREPEISNAKNAEYFGEWLDLKTFSNILWFIINIFYAKMQR